MTRLALNTVIVLAVLTGVYVVWQLRAAAVLFALSLAVAASLRPIIEWLVRHQLPRLVALLIVYSLVFGAVGLLCYDAGGPLVAQIQRLGDDFMAAYQAAYDQSRDAGGPGHALASSLPPPDDFLAAMAGEQGGALLQTALGATFTLFGMAVDLVIVLFLGVYWSIDRVHFERLWLSLLPVESRGKARELWWSIEHELGAYVRSEAVQSIAAGFLLWLGYLVLGHRYPLLLAMIGAVAWLIPWIGVLLAVTAVAVLSLPALILDPTTAATSLVPAVVYTSAVLLVMQLFIEPRFFDRRQYNALITAVIIFGMADVAGLMGLVLGAPLAAVLQIAGHQWMRLRLATSAENHATRDSFSERLSQVRTGLSRRKRPAPELTSLVDRLETIVVEAEGVLEAREPAADQQT